MTVFNSICIYTAPNHKASHIAEKAICSAAVSLEDMFKYGRWTGSYVALFYSH